MYAFIAFLFRPTVSTKYPLAQKCLFPYLYFRLACRSNIIRLLFPFRYPIIWDTLYFGRMLISIWMCSFLTLTRRLFLVYFAPRHRLFPPRQSRGLSLMANAETAADRHTGSCLPAPYRGVSLSSVGAFFMSYKANFLLYSS